MTWRGGGRCCQSQRVAVRLHRPDDAELATLLARCRDDSLTYTPVGESLGGIAAAGLTSRRWTTALPNGAFARAAEGVRSWAVQRGAGLVVVTDGPMAVGTNVVLS